MTDSLISFLVWHMAAIHRPTFDVQALELLDDDDLAATSPLAREIVDIAKSGRRLDQEVARTILSHVGMRTWANHDLGMIVAAAVEELRSGRRALLASELASTPSAVRRLIILEHLLKLEAAA